MREDVRAFLAGKPAQIAERRATLSEEATTSGAEISVYVPESHANFVFADLGRPAAPVFEQLLRKGIITRPVSGYGFPDALRISVGLRAHNERLVAALQEIL